MSDRGRPSPGFGAVAARVLYRPVQRGGRPIRHAVGAEKRRSLTEAIGGRTVVVTGASSGIGLETARRLADAGAHVAAVARRGDLLAALVTDIEDAGGVATAFPCDLADPAERHGLIAEVAAELGPIHNLVNCAGLSIRRDVDVAAGRLDDLDRTMQVNYLAAASLILAVLPSMRERGDGHIVNVSTVGVDTAAPRFAAYVASKAALDAFTECTQAEVLRDGVRFTTVRMPLVRTPMIQPPNAYRRLPQLSPSRAASLITDAIIDRPREIGTVAGTAASAGRALFPRLADTARAAAVHRTASPGRTA